MAYMRRGALVERFTSTASSAGTLTLLNNSTTFQIITGTQTHTVQLPDATTCDGGSSGKGGQKFYIVNNSTQRITINNAGGTRILFLPSKAEAMIVLTDDTTANGVWRYTVPTIIDQPMRASAGEPADSKVYFKANTVTDFDGTELVTPPVKGLIPTVPASTHDLQSGATTGATFNSAALPTTTIGQFRRIGYSLLPTGIIQVLYTPAVATEGALADPGTVFAKGALPIAWVDVEATGANAFKTIGSASAIVENYAGGSSRVHKFGSGGGGGSGTGDANSFLEDLKAFLRDSSYQWMTPNIFSISETALTDLVNTTGLYDVANSLVELDVGQTYRSTQLLGARFLADESADIAEVDLQVQYDLTGTDTAPDIFVSRNGGSEWQQVTANRIGESDKYQASHVFDAEASNQNLYVYSLANADTSVSLNATTTKAIAQPFTTTSKGKLKKYSLYFEKAGSPIGTIFIKIVKDSAGSPSASADDLVFSTSIAAANFAAGINAVALDTDTILANGTTYWMVVDSDDTYKTNNHAINAIQVRADSTSPGVPFAKAYNSSWTTAAYAASYLLQGFNYDLRVRIDSSMNDTKIKGIGIFFAKQQAGVPVGETPEVYRYSFSGDANEYSFTLPFTPDPDFLEVWDVGTGNAYSYPAFDIAGNTVSFLPGTFLSPGETVQLKFKQGSGFFDNSDLNRNLLAANHLGSTSGSNTLQSPGRGILLADEANSLKEIAIDSDRGLMIMDPSNLQVVDYHYGAADNILYNSDFFYTQRNEAKTYNAHSQAYLADRWLRGIPAGTGFTQIMSNPATGVYSSMRMGRAAGNSDTSQHVTQQALTTKDSIALAGKFVCVSFLAKKGANFSSTDFTLRVSSGTGTDQAANIGWTGQVNLETSFAASSFSTSIFQKYYTVVQIPASATQVKFTFIYNPTGTAGANDWIEVSQVMANVGRGPAKWSLKGKDYGGELLSCMPFYEKSYNQGTSPGNTTNVGAMQSQRVATTSADQFPNTFAVPKRATPVVNIYAIGSGTLGAIRDQSASADRAASAGQIGTTGCAVICSVAMSVGAPHAWHFTADAEL